MNEREYRSIDNYKASNQMVEGYASTFEPYVLFREGDKDYYERIEPTAFSNADMSDVVFRVDHVGAVYARSSAGTIKLDIDEHGLHQLTDLSKSTNSQLLFEDIQAGNYPKMSFAFTVSRDHYEADTNTRVIDEIAKVYDISAVSFPANPTTELHVRSWFNGEIETAKAEAERLEAQRRSDLERRAKLKERLKEVIR